MKLSDTSSVPCKQILPLLFVSLLMTACSASKPQYFKQTPPRVDCAADRPVKPLPPIPEPLTLDAAQIWIAQAIGVYHIAVQRRVTTSDCLHRLRGTGVIR